MSTDLKIKISRVVVLAVAILCLMPEVLFQLEQPSLRALSQFVGEWEGVFYVYTPDGQPVKSLKAHHIYKIAGSSLDGTQIVVYPDGIIEKVIAHHYLNEGKLYCRLESDKFGVKILEGRVDGSQIFWSRKDIDDLESFRERIVEDRLYVIDGYAIYGKDRSTVYTFFAEYKRVR